MSAGKVHLYRKGPSSIAGRLYDFGIAKAAIKPLHENWLLSNVVPILNNGGGLSVVGLTSRTADEDFNLGLSQRRAELIVNYLRTKTKTKFKVAIQSAVGEEAARLAGIRDNVESENWRAVVLNAWSFPDPPPPPPPPIPKPITMVDRRVFASFQSGQDTSERYSLDPPSTKGIYEGSKGLALEWSMRSGGYMIADEKKKSVPHTHKLTLVVLMKSSSSADYVISSAGITYTHVEYNWQKNYESKSKQPILLDKREPGNGIGVFRLTAAQAELFLKDPPKASIEMQKWPLSKIRIPYKNYQDGNY